MNAYTITLATLIALIFIPASVRAETSAMVRLTIGQDEVCIELLDNPAAKAFAAQLPLTLEFKDYAGAEKIATLPKRLSPQGSPSGREASVDFAYFVPWGNLAIYYNGLGNNGQILARGRIRTGKAVLGKQRTNPPRWNFCTPESDDLRYNT